MQVKSKRQKLGNSPYLSQQHQIQPQYSSGTLFYKKNRLNNSMYSTQEHHELPDYQAENKKLKDLIETMKQENLVKEKQLNSQIQSMKKVIDVKQNRIGELENRIQQLQNQIKQLENRIEQIQIQTSKKTHTLKDKIIQCQGIVKEIQQKQFNSSAHNMLETSRISRFNILDQTQNLHKNIPENSAFNAFNLQKTNIQSRQNLKNHQTQAKSIFYEERRVGLQRQVPKKTKSPEVRFNYTPPKIITPMSPVYRPQKNPLNFNSTISYTRQIHPENKNINPQFINQNRFPNIKPRVLIPQNSLLKPQVQKINSP